MKIEPGMIKADKIIYDESRGIFIYVDMQGPAFRRNDDGSFDVFEGGGWKAMPSVATQTGVNHE